MAAKETEADEKLEIEDTTQKEINNLKEKFKNMPTDMRLFSLSMRSLYTSKAVGTPSDTAAKFKKLRDDTREDGIVYLECILPISTKFVMSIGEYFENYDALSYEKWCEMLPDILEETTTYKEVAHTLLKMHQDMIVPLKKRQDEAGMVMTEFKDLQRDYEDKQNKFDELANNKRTWLGILGYIPFINFFVVPWLKNSANKDDALATAMSRQSDINKDAALVVADALIPALSNVIEGLSKAASFFQVMEIRMKSFEGRAEKSKVSRVKKLHFEVMKKEAASMKDLCQDLYAVLPEVHTDFEAIPNEETDHNLVDKWLEKTMTEIRKERGKVQKFFTEFWNLRKRLPAIGITMPNVGTNSSCTDKM